ncbi:MAG TPA: ABC transporter permease subunit [bacterium]|nr:ABC transporter permease subunit [bacterium]
MSATWVLYMKEIKSLFSSWIAYVIFIAFTLLAGLSFNITVQIFEIMTKYADSPEQGAARASMNVIDDLVSPLYQMIFMLLFIMVPAITMRLFAEEKKQRTEELLLTSPVRMSEILLAKYLAAASLITLLLLPAAIFPAIVYHYTSGVPDWGPMVSGYLGLLLLGYCLAAIGVFASSLTENQIVAFVFAAALEMIFFIMAQATIMFDVVKIGGISINMGAFLRAFSLSDHFAPLLTGIIKFSDLLYFASFIVFWLWATRQSLESERWG